ncbi:CocE/NonD family hydrolase [Streptomyces sp. NPDC018045]|uniref:CocE/NonD family hydrolase n=1 Tax=Streptomyces sp. NPDC018045 TaxID=3365037 RepID=UPI0037BACCE3
MRIVMEDGLEIPMRDGTVLHAVRYRPDGAGPLPTVIRRTPYGALGGPGGRSVDAVRLVGAGYHLLVQDVRGRFRSGGTFTPFVHEAADGADTVEWVAAQPWCDGTVGMFGRSYEGFAALLAAGAGTAALRAIVPHVAPADSYEGFTHQGGAFQLGSQLYWVLYDILYDGDRLDPAAAREVADALERIDELYREPWRAMDLLDRLAPYYRDWLTRPAGDAAWRQGSPNAAYPRMTASALHIGGWHDIFLGGTLQNYKGIRDHGGSAESRRTSSLLIGPWSHCLTDGIFPQRRYGLSADERAVDVTGLHIEHFDRHLKGISRGRAGEGRVRLFLTGADRWRTFPDWPVPGTRETAWYLSGGPAGTAGGGGTLADRPAAAGRDRLRHDPHDPVPTAGGATAMPGMFVGADCGPLDQRAVERRPDVLCYTTAELTDARTVIGDVWLTAFLSSTAPDTDIAAKLVDVGPDGRAELLCDGIQRVRHRASATPTTPLTPDQVVEVDVWLGAVGHVFAAGHRIRLEIAGSNAPRFDVHPGTWDGSVPLDEVRPVVDNTVHHGGAHASRLRLPVLTAG